MGVTNSYEGLQVRRGSEERGPAYEKLKFYQNICQIRRKIYELAERFARNEARRVSQMRDAARSAKQNVREGYSRDSAAEFARALRISRGSLSELEGDLADCHEDGLLQQDEYQTLRNVFRRTKYQMDRYLDALSRLDKAGKWKTRFQR